MGSIMRLPGVATAEEGYVPLYLAPQAGVSDASFRQLCRDFGADVVVTELVSAEGLRRGGARSWGYVEFAESERPIGVQLFGADPAGMAEAAAMVEQRCCPEFIDINFGCPARKVVNRNGGASCLRNPDLMQRIVKTVVRATSLPVTVKLRSGWCESSRRPVELGLRCQEAGAQAVALHPRTRAQMFSGDANWEEIAALVEELQIPVIGNGDVRSGEDARSMHESTGCAAVMIGRAAHGAPWIFRAARAALDGQPPMPEPGLAERVDVMLSHAHRALSLTGEEELTTLRLRKHLGWYTRHLPEARHLRRQLLQATRLWQVKELLAEYVQTQGRAA